MFPADRNVNDIFIEMGEAGGNGESLTLTTPLLILLRQGSIANLGDSSTLWKGLNNGKIRKSWFRASHSG